LFLLLPDKYHVLTALIFIVVVWSLFFGPTIALMQRLVEHDIRATILAVVMLLANLKGISAVQSGRASVE